ncbi:MAG: hypothetical protein A3J28_04700 [Acidobacteria bacterium RIFCSPLOWO2_12_FULL_60_22]|nr:MAG: hypothetical protein A3J28_04700 [Acidobacteria bacterium RIFCSPLOWO2_12_FULL_60_22]
MSRFYDVLKQASRTLHTPQEKTGAEESGGLPAEVADMLATVSEPGSSQVADSPASLLEKQSCATGSPEHWVADDIPQPADDAPSVPIPRNGSFGTSANLRLDHKARLLSNATDSMIVEHYRLLRTQVLQQQAAKMFRTLLVTSPGPGEGKTVTVLNLGLTFAMLPSFKVLVVEGDLRRGSMGKWFGINEDQPGLSNLVEGSVQLEEAVLKSGEIPFSFMVRGNSKLSAAELLHSPQLGTSLQEMATRYDLVIVDSPPANLVTDAQLLASACDAVLLVVRAFATSQKALEEATSKLLPFRVIGTVLNGASVIGPSYGYRGYY